jgi:type 1 glutamine amidotransferase
MKNRFNKNMKLMKNVFFFVIASVLFFAQCKEPASLDSLVVSDKEGNSGKDIQTILENTGLFNVDIAKGTSPKFASYDLVVLNVDEGNWNDKTKDAFAAYVKNGGGVVVLSNSGNAFSNWPDYQKIAGFGNKKSGSRSNKAYDFQVVNLNQEHPITNGLNKIWMHTNDYLLYSAASLDNNTEVLSLVKADTIHGGSGKTMPVLFTSKFGEGRVFHSTLGNNSDNSLQCVGFITTLQRGAEWAATGVVSQEVPVDFPNSVSTHDWENFQSLTLDEILNRSATYKVGKSKKYLSDFSMRIRNSDGQPDTYAIYESKILEFLASEATVDSKKYMCRQLSWMGSEKSLSVLEKLVNDKDLSESASYALYRLRL